MNETTDEHRAAGPQPKKSQVSLRVVSSKDELGHGPDGVQAGRRADHRRNPATAPGFETLGNARPGAAERNFVYQRIRDRSRGFALPSLKVKILNPQCGVCVAV